MPKNVTEPWYAEKRAMAYVYSLFAMKPTNTLTEVKSDSRYCIDLLVEVGEQNRLVMKRQLGVEIKGYREFPSTAELNRQMAKDPVQRAIDSIKVPLLVC